MLAQCARYDKKIEEHPGCEHQGNSFCDDCYMDILSPPKACDPWAVAASSFLYIAIADLIPEIHHKTLPGRGLYQAIFMGIGIGVIAFFRMMH